MSVRVIVILLALPLFLLLAGVNNLLLYQQEVDDMEQGLRGEALAAAVTVAEFAREAKDPFAELGAPGRLAAMRAAGGRIPGLDTLYLAAPDGRILNLLNRPAIVRYSLKAPDRPIIVGNWRDNERDPLIAARAPAGRGYVAVADIDARPLTRRAFHLKRLSVALIAGSAVLAILLGLIVSARVTREFRRTRAIIEAHGDTAGETGLGIREVRDLADAISLIEKSVSAELGGLEGDGTTDPAEGVRALRAEYFPDVSEERNGVAVAMRSLPAAPAGAFHLLAGDRIVIGEVPGEPAAALASAIALRDHLAAVPPQEIDRRLDLAIAAFGAERVKRMTVGTGPVAFALLDDAGAVEAYRRRNPGLDPRQLTADLAILYPKAGIIVAAGV